MTTRYQRPSRAHNTNLNSNLVLLASGVHSNTRNHDAGTDDLLTQEVTDVDLALVIRDGKVNGEMGIHALHDILEALEKEQVA